MDNSWVKLYRKILHNEEFNANTFSVFCWLLLMANKDTGIVVHGRFQISQYLKIHPSSVYRALKKLKKMKIIDMKSNNKRTTTTITNWYIYQSKPIMPLVTKTRNRTTSEQQANTPIYTRIRIKTKKEYIYNQFFLSFMKDFNEKFRSEYRPTKTLNELYNLRRNTFKAEEITKALRNLTESDYHMGKNDTGWKATPEFLLRTDETIDKFLNLNRREVKEYVDPSKVNF